MKNMIKLVAVAAFMLAAMSVSAQVKLGHINTQELIQAMPETAEARKTLETKQTEIENELTNMQESFRTKLEEYSKSAETMSDVIRASKEQELQELQRSTEQELFQPIMDKALNAIKEVGKENGFTYVFDLSAGGILYFADNTEDILPLVKKKLGLQ